MMFLGLLFILSLATTHASDPVWSLVQAVFGRPPTCSCVPKTNDYCHVVNVVHEAVESGWPTNIGTQLIISDDVSVNEFLLLSLQYLSLKMDENPGMKPDDVDLVFEDLVRIARLLDERGTSAVVWKDLKPYVQRLSNMISPTKLR
jgi:hypothetical protein